MTAAAASAAAAVAVKGDENHAFALGVGDFVLHGVKLVKAGAAKLRKFFAIHKNTSSKVLFPARGEKTKSKIAEARKNLAGGFAQNFFAAIACAPADRFAKTAAPFAENSLKKYF